MGRLRQQAGFTVLESMVAMVVLLVGLGAGMQLLDRASSTTAATKAREQAVALAREVVETARAVPYDKLSATGTAGVLQAANDDLRDSSTGIAGWNVRRRGVVFTISAGACAIDHPADGLGTKDPGTFCATGAGTTTAATCRTVLGSTGSIAGGPAASTAGAAAGDCGVDANFDGTIDGLTQAASGCTVDCAATSPPDVSPADTKRVVVLVRWDRGSGAKYVLQSGTIPFEGTTDAPVITGPTGPASITGGSSATYSVDTDRPATKVEWTVDGVPAAGSGSGTKWSLGWALGAVGATAPAEGEVLDGVHTIAARAFGSESSLGGQQRAVTVLVNRRKPYPLQGVAAGRDSSGVVVEWRAAREGDVLGYKVVRRPAAGGATTVVCAQTTATRCRDASPPATDHAYWAVALDKDSAGATREGDEPATKPVVRANNLPPAAPANVTLVRTASGVQLQWTASSGDPDPGDGVAFYRIYRDGTAPDDRLDRTLDGSILSYLDGTTGTRTRTYWVSAVDTQLGESAPVKAVAP